MNRLAIDAGPAHTGWAVELGGAIDSFGTRRFRIAGRTLDWEAECADAYSRWLTWMVQTHKPGAILIEDTFVARRSPDVRWVMWAHVATALLCRRMDLEYRPINGAAMKRFATGNGCASPAEMIAAARARGFRVTDDHQADAVMMLLSAAEARGEAFALAG